MIQSLHKIIVKEKISFIILMVQGMQEDSELRSLTSNMWLKLVLIYAEVVN